MAVSADIFGFHSQVMPLASSVESPGMLLNILQCTGQLLTTKNNRSKISLVLRWRDHALTKEQAIWGRPMWSGPLYQLKLSFLDC